MFEELENKNSIVTASLGGGGSSFVLYVLNKLCLSNNILYFDFNQNVDREFIKKNYNNVFNNVYLFQITQDMFFKYINELSYDIENVDYVVLDSADCFGKVNFIKIHNIFKMFSVNVISTSQLRVDPGSGKPYSTVEKWNSKIYQNSIWIRNVNEPNIYYKRKYVDIFDYERSGNKYRNRYILSYNKNGAIIERSI